MSTTRGASPNHSVMPSSCAVRGLVIGCGALYYARWSRGLTSDPSTFPIAVWLQSP